jgi:hypothetical protein
VVFYVLFWVYYEGLSFGASLTRRDEGSLELAAVQLL